MASFATRVKTTWQDFFKQQCSIIFHVSAAIVDPTDPVIIGAVALLNACTHCVCVKIEISLVEIISGSATSGVPYKTIDKALFNGVDADGQAHNWKVPTLKGSLLNTNKETINMADPLVIAYVGAVTGGAVGPGGAGIPNITDGHRWANRRQLKN